MGEVNCLDINDKYLVSLLLMVLVLNYQILNQQLV